MTPGGASHLHGPMPCRTGEYVPIDSHCARDEQSNLESNDEFLTKENVEETCGEDAEDAEMKGKNHCWRLQEQQRKTGKATADEVPPPGEDEEPKVGGGHQMIEGAEAVNSSQEVEAEPDTRFP